MRFAWSALALVVLVGPNLRAQPAATPIKPLLVWTGDMSNDRRMDRPTLVEVPNTYGDLQKTYRIDDTATFATFWAWVGRRGSVPDVDFTRLSVIVVFKDTTDIRIVNNRDGILVDFDVRLSNMATNSYTIAAFPKQMVGSLALTRR